MTGSLLSSSWRLLFREHGYCRERKYAPHDDPNDFAYHIQVKENAPDLLRRALSRAPVGQVGTGDYQAAEKKFGLSRKMLDVCLELGFPVFVLERSPLVLQDLDLLQAIDNRAVTEGSYGPARSKWKQFALVDPHDCRPALRRAIEREGASV